MISISNLSYFLGDRVLYDEASLFIGPKDRIGLIGLNGTGKSTLLKMIMKEVQPDEGEISKSKDTSIGFLNQDLLSYQTEEPILEVAMQAFQSTLDLQHKIDEVLHKMETSYSDDLVDKLTRLQEKFEAEDGYVLQSRAEEILEGIGFKTSDLKRPLNEFSGGWRMRVMLAKLLLEKPSLLLLDEPTNHLDLPSIQWIEEYLKTYDGSYIIVSHDRVFLNRTVNKIVEVKGGKLNVFSGNYDFYLQEKELRDEIQQNAYENQQQKIKQAERFVERFRAKSTKARQAQSRIKMLEKIERIDPVINTDMQVNFKFNFKTKSGRHVKRLHHVGKSYDELKILDNSNAHVKRGDKIALIGANGKGKSTLLRVIAETEPFEGKVETGHNVITSFYAQHQLEALGVGHEILEELKLEGTGKSEQELRNILGCFLFTGEEVFKKIRVLSGGEKSRVALAKTLISESNFLLLDEPTNHLDMLSVAILVQALQQYEGTFLLVSHDRHFISQVATKIWWIEDYEIKEYPGRYDEYEWWASKNIKTAKSLPKESPTKKETKPKPKTNNRDEKRLKELEEKISQLELSLTEIQNEMAKPENGSNLELLQELNDKAEKLKLDLENKTTEWEKMVERIES